MINIFAPINNLGYGVHARGWINGLYKWRKDLTLSVIGGIQAKLEEEEMPVIQELSRNSDDFNFKDPSLYIFHEQFGNCFVGEPMITAPVFETTELDKRSKNFLNQMDHVLSVSKWGAETLKANGVETPITVIPEGVDPNVFYQEPMTQDEKAYTIVTVGKWEVRKSSQEVITAFDKAFEGADEKIHLIAHMINPFMGNEFINTVAQFMNELGYVVTQPNQQNPELVVTKGNLQITIPMIQFPDRKHIAKLYKRAHLGVFASKAEGWNLPLCECLACGTPAIATYCTGQTEYLEAYDENLLIKNLREETANDGVWFKGNRGKWNVFDMDELIAKFKWAYENRLEARKIGSRYGELIRRDFSWSAAGKKLDEFFKGLE